MGKKLLLGYAVAALFFAVPLFAEEVTVDDMDTSASSTTYYGSGSVGVGNAWADGQYDNATYAGPSGRSFRLQWGYVDAADEYSGGGIFFNTNATPRDISAYNNVSFMVYTASASMKAEVQLKDNAAHVGKVKLSDYVTTVPNTWQGVVIPLDAFKRSNPSLDLTQAVIFQLVADYSHGLECNPSGDVYIDNLAVSRQAHAPASSLIYSGGDKGTAGLDDIAGDTLLWWDQAASTAASNEVTVRVSTGFSVAWVTTPGAAHTVAAGTTGYYAYQIRNSGNCADRIVLSTTTISGTWTSRLFWDKDKSGTFTAGDAECYDTIGLLPESTHYFLLAIYCPANATNSSNTQVRVTARDNFGSGANDNWPTGANDDTLTNDVTDTCATASFSVVKSTDKATGKPGETVTYTMTLTNTGSATADNVQLIDVIPSNVVISSDASGDDTPDIKYYSGSSWTGTRTGATKVRWVWSTVAAGHSENVSYTVTIK